MGTKTRLITVSKENRSKMPSAISDGRWTPWALLNAIDVKCKGDVIKLADRYKRTSKYVEDQSTQRTAFTSQLLHADKTTAEDPSAGGWQLLLLPISTVHQWKCLNSGEKMGYAENDFELCDPWSQKSVQTDRMISVYFIYHSSKRRTWEREGKEQTGRERDYYSNCLRQFIYWKAVYWQTVNNVLMPSGRYFPFEI